MAIFKIDYLEVVGVLTLLCTAILYYYFRVLAPYKNLPSYRLELKLLYWIITKKPLNSILFQHLMNILKLRERDGICVVWLLKPYVFICNEETAKLLMNDAAALDKPREYKMLEFCLKNSLFTINGEKWRRLRMLTSPALQIPIVRDNIDVYNENSVKLVQQLKIADPHETTKCLRECLFRAFLEAIYGLKAANPEDEFKINKIAESVEKLSKFVVRRILSPWLYWDFTLHIFPTARKSLKLHNELISLTRKMLDEAKEGYLENRQRMSGLDFEPRSLAEVLIGQHIKNPSFSLDDVLHQMNAIGAANSDGVPLSVMWCLFLLGHDADIQDKAFEEVMSETGETVSFEDLRNLKYLECIIKESLRLYPTIPVFARQVKKDFYCGKHKIPENSTVVMVPYILHRNPNVFPDPEKFNPDRFMEPNSKINEGNYVPFAEGIRSCPGKNFVMTAMKVFLCHVIRNFRIVSLDRREDVVLSWEIVLSSLKNLRIKFIPR